jgi:hypothetical protein
MQYALLIYEDETLYDRDDSPQMQAIIGKHMSFGEQNGPAIRGGAALRGTASATTVRTQSGRQVLHDGPFAETKEQLGGLYLIEAADLDAAIAIARQIPLVGDGAIEVRPLLPLPDEQPST